MSRIVKLSVLLVALADAIFIYAGITLKRSPRRASSYAKAAMLLALVAFLFGGLA